MNADEYKRQIRQDVNDNGWHICIIAEDHLGPAFAYTIGLEESFGHPELVMFGLDPGELGGLMHRILNVVGEMIKSGYSFSHGVQVDDILEGHPCAFRVVDLSHYSNHFGCGRWFHHGDDFRVLQMVWPDGESRFPWDDGFEEDLRWRQPLLDCQRSADPC